MGESRYTSLNLKNPDRAAMLFDKAAGLAKEKYEHLLKLQEVYGK